MDTLAKRLPGNLNVSIEGVDGAALLLGLQSIVALSSGSACTSTTTKTFPMSSKH